MASPTREPLSATELDAALAELSPFRVDDAGRLRATFRFASFADAFGFMSAIAVIAERLDHHPDWSNSWCTVTVALSTHDAGTLTQLDLKLAREMVRLTRALGAQATT